MLGPLLKSMPDDILKQRSEMTLQLLYNAIYNNDWEPYTEDLIKQGALYAQMGITFSMWYEVWSVSKDFLMPLIIKEHGHSLEKTTGLFVG